MVTAIVVPKSTENKTFLCPHCNVLSLHNHVGGAPDYTKNIILKGKDGKNHKTDVGMYQKIYKCVNCQKDTYFLTRGEAVVFRNISFSGLVTPDIIAESPSETIHQYPISIPASHPSVNQDVMHATIEAEKCFLVGAYNACGVMTRRAIHSLCTDKKAKGKDLFEQLKYLKEKNLITPDLWEWCEELRIIGRSGAHPEWEEVSKEDADYALKFLREIIRYVYINPAERASRRLKETKKKKP